MGGFLMADDTQTPENDADLLAAPGPKTRPWSHIAVGMVGAIALGLTALVLARYFTMTRPIDLMPTTAALGDYLERVMRDNLVPAEAIHRSKPILREEAGCRWYFHDFKLDLPPQISADGLRELLVRGMSERQVRVSSEDPLEFALGPYPFATVLLRDEASRLKAERAAEAAAHAEPAAHHTPSVPQVPKAPEPVDPAQNEAMRNAARAVAMAALGTLRNAGAPAEALPVLAEHDTEAAGTPWVLTQVTLTGWTPPSLESLLSTMNAAVTPLEGTAVVSGNGVEVSHAGHVVVAITLPATPGSEQPVEVATLTPTAMPEAPHPAEPPAAEHPTATPVEQTTTPALEDLQPEAIALGDLVRAALVESGIADENIVALPNEDQADATARWTCVHLQVRGASLVPPTKVLATVVSKVVRPGVEASIDESAGQPELLLKLGARQVVIVELAPRAEPEMAIPSDEDLPPETMVDPKEGEGVHTPPPTATPPTGTPRIALILDDGGYGKETTETILGMDPKLTLSILPFTPFGEDTAKRGAALGFEIMLHMPMEPFSAEVKFKGQLNVGMGKDEVAKLTQEAIATVPGLVGINNHTGSKFTSDEESMKHFFEAISGQPYYFIDSYTTGKSKAYDAAKAAGFRVGKRSVFLDDKSDTAYIRKQFEILRAHAKRDGAAIGIGHFRPATVKVLPEELTKIDAEGIDLVHASELVQ